MIYTSINHCKNGNYQIDHNEIASFERWCINNDAIWAHLFRKRTGEMVATFNSAQGLTTLAHKGDYYD